MVRQWLCDEWLKQLMVTMFELFLLARKWLCWYWMILCVFVPSKTKQRKNWPCQNWQRFKKRSWGPGLCGSKCIQMSHEKIIITIILFHDFTTFLIAKAKASKALVGLVWWAHNPIESPIYPRYSFPIWSSSKVFQLHDPLEPLGLLHLGPRGHRSPWHVPTCTNLASPDPTFSQPKKIEMLTLWALNMAIKKPHIFVDTLW